MLNFEKPNYKITDYMEKNNYGKFELEPLERGFGTTLGNSLRRVMLSSMPGTAIVAAKIDGVMHEFQTLEGVVEDVTTIILNLKSVVLKNHSKETKVAHISSSKEGVVTAGDIEVDSDIEIVNKNQVIATLAKGGKLIWNLLLLMVVDTYQQVIIKNIWKTLK
jgi:DNA-directed RNA polymerase subunit alpha